MHGDWIDALQLVLGALVGWFVEWLRGRRKAGRGVRKLSGATARLSLSQKAAKSARRGSIPTASRPETGSR